MSNLPSKEMPLKGRTLGVIKWYTGIAEELKVANLAHQLDFIELPAEQMVDGSLSSLALTHEQGLQLILAGNPAVNPHIICQNHPFSGHLAPPALLKPPFNGHTRCRRSNQTK